MECELQRDLDLDAVMSKIARMEIGVPYLQDERRSDLLAMQRERDREKRRLRDRLRRQSMSQEQREKHLARRRRNYQLRRIRAESTSKLSPNQNVVADTTAESAIAVAAPQPVAIPQSVFTTEGSEDGVQKLQTCSRRLRLCQIRCLARALHRSVMVHGYGSSHQSGGDLGEKQTSFTLCGSVQRLRFIHVKRLARALNSSNASHLKII